MLPSEPMETAPGLDLTPHDREARLDELRVYHAIYSPLFQRRAQREGSDKYLHGWLLELPRQSIEPMVWALDGTNRKAVRALQQCLSEGARDEETILRRHGQEVEPDRGDDDGVLTLDGSDVPQQGPKSVGVTRQYGGELGQRAHCQAGVFLGDASLRGYTLLARRRYLPQAWVEDAASADRRAACGVPADVIVTTKPRWGWALIQALHQARTRRCRWVAGDEACGRDPTRLDHIAGLGWWYDAEVPHDTRVWPERPATVTPPWSGRGRQPTRLQVGAGAAEAQPVASEPVGAADDPSREPRTARGGVCGDPCGGRPRWVARAGGVVDAAASWADWRTENLSESRTGLHAADHPGADERHALAHRNLRGRGPAVPRHGRR
jgi:SRSO17 transposase